MADIFNILFSLFEVVISSLKKVPIIDGVSLFDFSIGLLIFTIICVAFIPIVKIGADTVSFNVISNDKRIAREEFKK